MKLAYRLLFILFLPVTLTLTKPPSIVYIGSQKVAATLATNVIDESFFLNFPHDFVAPIFEFLLPFYEVNRDSKSFNYSAALKWVIEKNPKWALDILRDMEQKFPHLKNFPQDCNISMEFLDGELKKTKESSENLDFLADVLKESINRAQTNINQVTHNYDEAKSGIALNEKNKKLICDAKKYTKIAELVYQSLCTRSLEEIRKVNEILSLEKSKTLHK